MVKYTGTIIASDNKIKISPNEMKGGKGKRSKGFVSFPIFTVCRVCTGFYKSHLSTTERECQITLKNVENE